MLSDFYKDNDNNKIWRIDNFELVGQFLFSFDKKHVYNFWSDYPEKLSESEIDIFDKEFPEMAKLKAR